MKRFYIIAAILGAILTPIAHKMVTVQRGYRAVGGEFLLIPLFMLIVLAKDQVKYGIEEFKEIFEEEEENRKCTKQKAQSTTRC